MNKTMEIVIYEDDKKYQTCIRNMIVSTLNKEPILATDSPTILEKYIHQSKGLTLYFLDIVIRSEQDSGLDMARKIIAQNNGDLIVFITSHNKLLLGQTYLQIKSFNLIDKSSENIELQIKQTLELAMELAQNTCLIIEERNENHYIPTKNILFVESIKGSHRTRVHTNYGIFEVNKRLHEYTLDSSFIYMRRTHIVNRYKIRSLDFANKAIRFSNETECPFSLFYAKKNGF